jgi:hypothetical protein
MPARVRYDDLEQALYWVSSPPEFEADAFVSRTTGKVYFRGTDGPVNDDFPEDIEDGAEYIAFPHKNDLDLGRDLVFRFVNLHAAHLQQQVHQVFRHKGAYSGFKGLLARNSLLDNWHEYERQATQSALEEWALENGFTVEHASGDA